MLKRCFAMILILLLFVVGSYLYDKNNKPELVVDSNKDKVSSQVYETIDDISFTPFAEDKTSFMLSDIKAPVIFLHFWASWCAPCQVEIPDILKLADSMDGKLAVIAISIDEDLKKLDKFMKRVKKKLGDDFNVEHVYWVTDTDKKISLDKFGVVRVPETIVVSKDRKMIRKIIGENDWLSDTTKSYIDEALAISASE